MIEGGKSISIVGGGDSILIPGGSLWSKLDRNKIFREKTSTYIPKPIDWRGAIDEKGNFDEVAFMMSRSGLLERRKGYLEDLNDSLRLFNHMKEKNDIYILDYYGNKVLKAFTNMYFLGNSDNNGGEVYRTKFYSELKSTLEGIKEGKLLGDENDTLLCIIDTINQALQRESGKWSELVNKEKEGYFHSVNSYLNKDGSLNIDNVLEKVGGWGDWNDDVLLVALYRATCSRSDLIKLQDGVLKILDEKMKKLKTHHIFAIINTLLPYIYDKFTFNWQPPEIFRPYFMNHIGIHNLTIESFTDQVRAKGGELGWSGEIQDKLIEQFKLYGTDKEGNIGFGQGSEQLRYWIEPLKLAEKCVGRAESNFFVDPDFEIPNKPIPKILASSELEFVKELPKKDISGLLED